MNLSKKVLFLLFTITCLTVFTGCDNEKIPSGSYRVEIEDVFEMSDFSIKKLEITTKGTRRVHIQLSPGNQDMTTLNPDKGSKYAKATILVVAEKITTDKTSFVLLRWPITTKGVKMSGCSALIDVSESVNLKDECELMLKSGMHPIGQAMDFARIHDKRYSILVN